MNLISTSIVADRILDCLARYRFLTMAQLLDTVAGDQQTVQFRLGELVTAGYVMRQEFRLGPTADRLPDIHWLSRSGARLIEDATGEPVTVPDSSKLSVAHIAHHTLTVSTLIAADAWARQTGQAVPEFRTGMESSRTRLQLLDRTPNADAVLDMRDPAGNRRVYIVEVFCSQDSESGSMHPIEQLESYVLNAMGNTLDEAVGVEQGGKPARVLVVCDTFALRNRIISTLPTRPGLPPVEFRTWGKFLFKTPDELKEFGRGWWKVDGSLADLPILERI